MGRHDCGYSEQYVLFVKISTTQNLENILVQIVNLIRIPQMRPAPVRSTNRLQPRRAPSKTESKGSSRAYSLRSYSS
jgi:hypothetical protein